MLFRSEKTEREKKKEVPKVVSRSSSHSEASEHSDHSEDLDDQDRSSEKLPDASLFETLTAEEQQARAARREEQKALHSSQFKNCYRGDQSKEDKMANRKKFRQTKRNDRKKKAKDKKKEFLKNLPEEERIAWIEEKGKRVLQEMRDAEAKLMLGKDKGMTVVVDNSFEDQMHPKELKSLAQQLNYINLRMKKSQNLFRLAITNYAGKFPEISKERNIHNWKHADLEPGDIIDYLEKRGIPKHKAIYLSPDGEEEIKEFTPDHVYIIGGLVDNTVNLNQTKTKARDTGIKAMKLPLEEFRKVNHFRPCLNINTVFYIIDNFITSGDMNRSILEALPERFSEEYVHKPRGAGKLKDAAAGGQIEVEGIESENMLAAREKDNLEKVQVKKESS